MPYDIANAMRSFVFPDLRGTAELLQRKREFESRNALAEQNMELERNKLAAYQQQVNQNALLQTSRDQQAALERVRQWAPGAIAQARQNPARIAALVQEGQRLGVIDLQRDPASVTMDDVESFATQLGIGPAEAPKYGQPFGAQDNQGPGFFRTNPQTGGVERVAGLRPIPPVARRGMSVTTPDGTTIQLGGDGSPVDLSKPTRTKLEDAFTNSQANLWSLSDVLAQWNPEFSTWLGQGKYLAMTAREKSGIPAARLSDQERQQLGQFSTWRSNANSALSTYLNQLSGAAISPAEEARLRAGFPNDQDGPTEFKAKVEATVRRFSLVQARAAYLLANPTVKLDSISIDQMQARILSEANKLAEAYVERGMDAEAARQRAIVETKSRYGLSHGQ